MEVADLDEFYPTEIYEDELLSQKIYSLGRYQTAVTEKLEGEFIRPRRQVTAWMNFFSREIKDILSMERRLYDENSEESVGLLQSVIQQLKTMNKYIADHMEPTLIDSDSVSDSTQKSSIPLAEEEDSSVDCKLIPSFLFEETEYSTSVDSKFFFPKVILNFHKILNGDGECCSIILNSSRYIFDRGKEFEIMENPDFVSNYEFCPGFMVLDVCSFLMDKYDWHFVKELLYKHGYWSNSWFRDQIVCMLANGSISTTAWKMFVKMPPIDMVCFELNFFLHYSLPTEISSHPCLKSGDKVFDRGKEFHHFRGLFSSNCESEDHVGAITSFVIIILGYCFDLLESANVALFVQYADNCDDSQMFHKSPPQSNAQQQFDQLLAGFKFSCDAVFTSGSFILHVGSISIAYHTENSVHKLLYMHGFESDSSFCASIFLVSVTTSDRGQLFPQSSQGHSTTLPKYLSVWMLISEIQHVNELFHQMLEISEEEIFLRQLQYVLPEVFSFCQFESLVAVFIRLLHVVFKPETAGSHQVIKLLNTYVTLVRLHGYSIKNILAIVQSYFRILRMSLFFSSSWLTSAAIHGEEMKKSVNSTSNALHSLYFVRYNSCNCKQWWCVGYGLMRGCGWMRIIQLLLTVKDAPIVSKLMDFLRWKYKLHSTGMESVTNVSWTTPVLMWLAENQLIFKELQVLQVWLLVGCLRWKFRLIPPSLGNVRNVQMSIQFSIFGFDTTWTSPSNVFYNAPHNPLAPILMMIQNTTLLLILDSLLWVFLRSDLAEIVDLEFACEQLDWLVSEILILCPIMKPEEMVNQLHHLGFYKVKTGEKSVYMRAYQAEKCEDTGPVYRRYVTSSKESRSLASSEGKVATRCDNCRSRGLHQMIPGLDCEVCKVITEIFIGLAKFLDSSGSFVFDRGKVFASHVWSSWYQLGRNSWILVTLVRVHLRNMKAHFSSQVERTRFFKETGGGICGSLRNSSFRVTAKGKEGWGSRTVGSKSPRMMIWLVVLAQHGFSPSLFTKDISASHCV